MSVFPKFRKVGRFAAFIDRPKAKNALASGGLPLDPAGGSAPRPLL